MKIRSEKAAFDVTLGVGIISNEIFFAGCLQAGDILIKTSDLRKIIYLFMIRDQTQMSKGL